MLLSHDPPSIYEALERKEGGVTPPTTVPIILPKNTVMGLHINRSVHTHSRHLRNLTAI